MRLLNIYFLFLFLFCFYQKFKEYVSAFLIVMSLFVLTIFVGQVCNGANHVCVDMVRNKKDGNEMLMVEGMLLHSFVMFLLAHGELFVSIGCRHYHL